MSIEKDPPLASSGQPKWLTITGWVITAVIGAQFVMSAVFKLIQSPMVLEGFGKDKFDIPLKFVVPIGILEVICLVLYLFPRTAILGSVLLTGYLGGAIMTHLRVNDNFAAPIIVGVLLWLGIFLREPRLRAIMPLR
jgi:hypothetical protein